MARFTREFLDNDVPAGTAWGKITDAIKSGHKSVEVRSRVVNGEDKWELRYWNAIREDKSNSGRASPNKDY